MNGFCLGSLGALHEVSSTQEFCRTVDVQLRSARLRLSSNRHRHPPSFAGAKIWFDYVNSTGGINGPKIVHSLRDDGGDPNKTVELTRELLDSSRTTVLFGYVGDDTVAAVLRLEMAKRAGIALIAPLSGTETGGWSDNVIYARSGYSAEARAIVRRFRSNGLTRFAVLYMPGEAGQAVHSAIDKVLRRDGIVPVLVEPMTDGQVSESRVMALLKAAPQVVVVAADTIATAQFLRQYKACEPGVLIVGLSTVNHTVLTEFAGGKLAAGMLLTQVVPDPFRVTGPLQREHIALMKRFRDEAPNHLTLEGFIAGKLLVEIIRRAGKDPTKASILAAMQGLRTLTIADQVLQFSETSNRGSGFVDVTFLRSSGSLLH